VNGGGNKNGLATVAFTEKSARVIASGSADWFPWGFDKDRLTYLGLAMQLLFRDSKGERLMLLAVPDAMF